jgi:hypothetical protein
MASATRDAYTTVIGWIRRTRRTTEEARTGPRKVGTVMGSITIPTWAADMPWMASSAAGR